MRPLRSYDRSAADGLHPGTLFPSLRGHEGTQWREARDKEPLRPAWQDNRQPAERRTDMVRGSTLGRRPPRDDELRRQNLHDLAALIQGLAAHRDHSSVRPRARGRDLDDLAFHMQDVARPRGLGPVDLSARADDPAG